MSTSNHPPLYGLVLAGGESRRMGRDKGSIRYHDDPQAAHAWRLLTEVCARAYVSTNPRNAAAAPYKDLPLILDDEDYAGPAAGLVAAWARHPHVAWLALAVDMPLVDRPLLDVLRVNRNAAAPATVFRHSDGMIEPVCAIWEPGARESLLEQFRAGNASLRRFLERSTAERLVAPDPEKLRSVNDLDEYREAVRVLRGEPADRGF